MIQRIASRARARRFARLILDTFDIEELTLPRRLDGSLRPSADDVRRRLEERVSTALEHARDTLVVGPWHGAVADEVRWWIPFLRRVVDGRKLDPGKVVAASHCPPAWYWGIASRVDSDVGLPVGRLDGSVLDELVAAYRRGDLGVRDVFRELRHARLAAAGEPASAAPVLAPIDDLAIPLAVARGDDAIGLYSDDRSVSTWDVELDLHVARSLGASLVLVKRSQLELVARLAGPA